MENGKLDNQLSLSLSMSEEERAATLDLNVGFISTENVWELIVKYSGDITSVADELGAEVNTLMNGFAIMLVRQEDIQRLSEFEEIEYIEKPRKLFFEIVSARAASCTNQVQALPLSLSGRGVLTAVIDSGIDFRHPDFRNADGTTRIRYLWDQSLSPASAIEQSGNIFTAEDIDRTLLSGQSGTVPQAVQNGTAAQAVQSGTVPQAVQSGTVPQAVQNGTAAQAVQNGTAAQAMQNETATQAVQNGTAAQAVQSGTTTQAVQNGAAAQAVQSGIVRNIDYVQSIDSTGHGTAVAGILCGNGRASEGRYRGIAYESELLVVKLGTSLNSSFPRTTQLMAGVDFCIRRSMELKMPLVINISFGNNYGAHDGSSLLENYLDEMANTGTTCIIAATGNEGATGHHFRGRLENAGERISCEFSVAEGERNLNLQLWKDYSDDIAVTLRSPGGAGYRLPYDGTGTLRFGLEGTEILSYYGEPQPYNRAQEIFFTFIPGQAAGIPGGVWSLELEAVSLVSGEFDCWLPAEEAVSKATRFLRPNEDTTLTIPSTARRLISVAAYDSNRNSTAYFSGRGFTRGNMSIKPDLAAPGVGILTATPGGYSSRTGTSFAAPFVSGAAALLMQWGIVQGNDPYLYDADIFGLSSEIFIDQDGAYSLS